MRPRISVAMATYNGEKYLREQLDSLANQTVMPCELVVCDDGSTDSTVQIVRAFCAAASFTVHLHVNEINLGYSDNFMKAAGLCRGDWIAFCDQDDFWLKNKLERLMEVIEHHPGDELLLIGHSSLMANEKLEPNGRRLPDFKRDNYVGRGANYAFFGFHGFSMMCRARLVHEIDASMRPRAPDTKGLMGHDHWVCMLANALGCIAFVHEPLAIWRRHESSLTRPPAHQNIVELAKTAKAVLTPDSYLQLSGTAKECADAFRKLALSVGDRKIAQRLKVTANNFDKLASNFSHRADLYAEQSRLKKIRMLARLLKSNAYFGPKFCSLGWRPLAKDAAVAFGVIG